MYKVAPDGACTTKNPLPEIPRSVGFPVGEREPWLKFVLIPERLTPVPISTVDVSEPLPDPGAGAPWEDDAPTPPLGVRQLPAAFGGLRAFDCLIRRTPKMKKGRPSSIANITAQLNVRKPVPMSSATALSQVGKGWVQ